MFCLLHTCFTPTCCTLWAYTGFSFCGCRSHRLLVRPTPAKPLPLVLSFCLVQRRRGPIGRRACSGCWQKYGGSFGHETGQLDSHLIQLRLLWTVSVNKNGAIVNYTKYIDNHCSAQVIIRCSYSCQRSVSSCFSSSSFSLRSRV